MLNKNLCCARISSNYSSIAIQLGFNGFLFYNLTVPYGMKGGPEGNKSRFKFYNGCKICKKKLIIPKSSCLGYSHIGVWSAIYSSQEKTDSIIIFSLITFLG